MLDAEEYNRRIEFIKAKRNRVNDFSFDFLYKLPQQLLSELDDKNAPPEYRNALGESIRRCRAAVENHFAKRISILTCRAEVATALDTLHDVFVQLRDKSTVTAGIHQLLDTFFAKSLSDKQAESNTAISSVNVEQTAELQAPEPVSNGRFTLVSEGLTSPRPIPPAPHFQPGAKLTLEEASGLGEELTLEEASGLGIEAPKMPREKVQEEDWKGKYEETNTLLEKTQALLVQTKADFTTWLQHLERTLADEQKAVLAAQNEKEATANTVKENLGKKQWRIQELEHDLTMEKAKGATLEDENGQIKSRYAALEKEVEAYSVRVAQVAAGYAEMQAHWTEMAQALKLRQGAEQAAQSVQSGAASCSTPLRRFLEKFVAEVRPNAPPQSPAV